MKLRSPYCCDECSRPKSESTRLWFLLKTDADAFELMPWDDTLADEQIEGKPAFRHMCDNVACVTANLRRWCELQINAAGRLFQPPQSANAEASQPTNDSREERQKQTVASYLNLHPYLHP